MHRPGKEYGRSLPWRPDVLRVLTPVLKLLQHGLGEIEAHDRPCQPFNKDSFKEALKKIRELTTQAPEKFSSSMVDLCAESGVALVFVPETKKVPWHGATKWLSASKAMILLNLRCKKEDIFWFSFFHEAGHVLNDGKKYLYINDGTADDPAERQANEYAAQMLIPKERDEAIRLYRSKAEIVFLADILGVSPGIVAGRYQHLTGKWNLFSGLIRKFQCVQSNGRN